MKCSICKKTITGHSHNPSPVTIGGRCCHNCNFTVVLPKRIKLLQEKDNTEQEETYTEEDYQCSECGNPVNKPHQYCSANCFNAGHL